MPELIDICMCTDYNYLIPTSVAINSTILNTKYNRNFIRFNILCSDKKTHSELEKLMFKIKKIYPNILFRICTFQATQKLKSLIKKISENKRVQRLGSYHININEANYSRFYFKNYFNDLGRIIYLDSDIIVIGDIKDLYSLHNSNKVRLFNDNAYLLAFDRNRNNNTYYNWKHPCIKSIEKKLKKKGTYFNAGIYLTDLNDWVKYNIIKKIEKCIEDNVSIDGTTMYLSGTEPPLNIVFINFIPLNKIWNYTPKKKEDQESVRRKAKLLHFKGPLKPWKKDLNKMARSYGKLWESYLIK